MDGCTEGILLPGLEIRLHLDLFQAVECHDVKFPHGAVIFWRIARRDHDPALRKRVAPEGLVLQELQHGRREGLGDAVDLVEKEDALRKTGGLHRVVDAGNDLRHRVFRYLVSLSAVVLLRDIGEAEGALPGVVGHGVGDQDHAQLLGDLFHDRGLADARRADEEDRALAVERDLIIAQLVFCKIGGHRVFDLFLRFLNIHSCPSSFSRMILIAQTGTSRSSYWSSRNTNAAL